MDNELTITFGLQEMLFKVNHLKTIHLAAYYVKCLNYVAHSFIRITNKATRHNLNSFLREKNV